MAKISTHKRPIRPVLNEVRLAEDATVFRASPMFETVLRDYTFALTRFRRDPRVVNKLISHETRFRVVSHFLFLHAEKVLAGGEGGVTYSEMTEICSHYSNIGLRVLKAMLPMLVLTGFAEVARNDQDRRVKTYMPSGKLFALARTRLASIVAALQVLQPDVQRAASLRDDPLYLMRALFNGGPSWLADSPLVKYMQDFVAFAGGREGAAQVVYVTMLADMDGTPLLSRAAIAKEFGLSKTQVWSVFTEGERLGYFSVDGSAVPVATDKLRDQYRSWTAMELAVCADVLSVEDF